jgi:hypothetical protein
MGFFCSDLPAATDFTKLFLLFSSGLPIDSFRRLIHSETSYSVPAGGTPKSFRYDSHVLIVGFVVTCWFTVFAVLSTRFVPTGSNWVSFRCTSAYFKQILQVAVCGSRM